MTGFSTINRIKCFEERANRMGFAVTKSDWGDHNELSLRPFGDALPVYSRTAEVFRGSMEAAEWWLQGFEDAQRYDNILFGRNHIAKRQRREQDERNRRLMEIIKTGEQPE